MDQRRRQYLEAMGIPLWTRRLQSVAPEPEVLKPAADPVAWGEQSEPRDSRPAKTVVPSAPSVPTQVGRVGAPFVPTDVPLSPPVAAPSADVPPAWLTEAPPPLEEPLLAEAGDEGVFSSLPDRDDRPRAQLASMDWEALRAYVETCARCPLRETRTQTVFGVGDQKARLMVIGEAPGADEDRQGEPFVGRAGQLLNAMLLAMGLKREQVYIANVLKCRPPDNRNPKPEEIACCVPVLQRQIELVAPSVILAAGRIAAQHLLHSDEPVGRLRGRVHRLGKAEIPLVVTYHPAYLLRSPDQKAAAWQDLQRVLPFLSQAVASSS